MKKCAYCGWENSDGLDRCEKCQTEFPPSHPGQQDAVKVGPVFLPELVRYLGIFLLITLCYALSLGPVLRYCRSSSVTTTTRGPTGFTTIYTTRYPGWIHIIYYPAISAAYSGGADSLYGRYIHWWESLGQE